MTIWLECVCKHGNGSNMSFKNANDNSKEIGVSLFYKTKGLRWAIQKQDSCDKSDTHASICSMESSVIGLTYRKPM